MFRFVTILVVIGLASVHAAVDKATCAEIKGLDLRLCGKFDGKVCVPLGKLDADYIAVELKSLVGNVTEILATAETCSKDTAVCNATSPKKSDYCTASGGYCKLLRNSVTAWNTCSADADCKDDGWAKTPKNICCNSLAATFPCDYTKETVDFLIAGARNNSRCADSNCNAFDSPSTPPTTTITTLPTTTPAGTPVPRASNATLLRFSMFIPAVAAAFAMIASAF